MVSMDLVKGFCSGWRLDGSLWRGLRMKGRPSLCLDDSDNFYYKGGS